MGILAEEERLGGILTVLSYHAVERGIHARIDVGGLVHAFVMDDAVVESTHGITLGHDIAAAARLVAQRPENDRGMVLVALNHAHGTVDISFFPLGIV